MNRKKILLSIATVIFLIGGGFGIWYAFFSGSDAQLTVTNPFDSLGSDSLQNGSNLPTDGVQQGAGTELAPRFIKITDGPVARGAVAFRVQVPQQGTGVPATGTSTAITTGTTAVTKPDVQVQFIDRASGNVYAYVARERTLTRISNKTLPGVQEAVWVADGSRAYARFIAATGGNEQVSTYALPARGDGGFLLEQDLDQVAVAGTSTLMTLFSGTTGSVGTIANADGSNSRTLFSSVLSSIRIKPSRGSLFTFTKPSNQLDGYAFEINRTTGSFSRIIGPLRGLSILPNPAGTSVLYSYIENGAYRLRVLDVAKRTTTALPVATLTEKCVWAADGRSAYCGVPTSMQGNLPDSWYQGITQFSDRIWKIDMQERVAALVVDPQQVGKVSVDAVVLAIDPFEDFLIFTDKASGALYSYDL